MKTPRVELAEKLSRMALLPDQSGDNALAQRIMAIMKLIELRTDRNATISDVPDYVYRVFRTDYGSVYDIGLMERDLNQSLHDYMQSICHAYLRNLATFPELYVCSSCGNHETLQVKAWVTYHGNHYCGEINDGDVYCTECETLVKIVPRTQYLIENMS